MIHRALFVETGTYNDMSVRPYDTELDLHKVHQLQEVTDYGRMTSADAMSSIAGQILRPMAQGQGTVQIANGWDVPRLRFILEIEHPATNGMAALHQIITGYTDYAGFHAGVGTVSIDPNMRLFFNNVMTLRAVEHHTSFGSQVRTNVADASHIIATSGLQTPGFGQPYQGPVTMRPMDVYGKMATAFLGDDTLDTRPSFAEGPVKKSKRGHGSASQYMSSVITAYEDTLSGNEGYADDYMRTMSKARTLVSDAPITQDLFLMEVNKRSSFCEGGSLTYAELCSIEPSLDYNAKVIPARSVASEGGYQQHNRGQSEYWTTPTTETVNATILSHSVPSIMMDLMLTRVAFVATNRTINGDYDVRIADARSFAQGVDLSPYLSTFQQRLRYEILQGLSCNNQLDFEITAMIDVLGETRITISMNGGPAYDFVTPSFCDALMSPVVANGGDVLEHISGDLTQLVDNLHTRLDMPGAPSTPGGNNDFSSII